MSFGKKDRHDMRSQDPTFIADAPEFKCPTKRMKRACGAAQMAHRGDTPGVRILCTDCKRKFLLRGSGWTEYGQ